MCEPREWQPMQTAFCSATELFESLPNRIGIVPLPPPASTCAWPGPWHASHPRASSGLRGLSIITFPIAVYLKRRFCSSWQVMHTSLPTWPASELACVFAALSCSGAGLPLSCDGDPELRPVSRHNDRTRRRSLTSLFWETSCIRNLGLSSDDFLTIEMI